MGNERANKALVMRIIETLINRGEVREASRLIDPQVMGRPMGGRGPHEALAVIQALRGSFPDLALAVDDLIAEGDRVVATWTMTGTHLGRFLTVEPTGRGIRVPGVTVFDIRRGRWAAASGSWDLPLALAQIGAPIPGMSAAAAPGDAGDG